MRGLAIGGAVLVLLGAASLMAQPSGAPGAAAQPETNGVSQSPATMAMPITGFLFKSLAHGGKTFNYVVYVPRGYDPAVAMPLVVFLHGSGECGTDGQKHMLVGIGPSLVRNPERWPCLVLMPQKPESRKQWEDYAAPVMAMLAATQKEYTIDATRVSLTGLSQGGHGTWLLGSMYPEIWCAIAPICGYAQLAGQSGPESAVGVIAPRLRGMPMWVFHGDMDEIVDPAHSTLMVEAMRREGGIPVGGAMLRHTRYPGTKHNSWDKAYAEEYLPQFLLTPRVKK